ncbi:surface lipoprotein assembly modifier [Loktanella sp. S4079]|uniref:surface lipoprotein assembly modifier n=1 Tax=Loktanella sp. S4079 TaxID=579483 RepID=UPI0005FA27DE|nr:surface lipoprotein assembly modifier [Loktanella sp. S4079]KJZ20588.1 hypothetical protein TW80_07370 [Loktanella sp. S4079]
MRLRTLALITCLFTQPAAAQTAIDVTIEQARTIATRALQAGDYETAQEIARQLLAQHPDDRVALLVMAATLPRTGEPAQGRAAGARAWRLSNTDAEKFEAARLTAGAAVAQERFTLATLWLRRALIVAPTDADYDRTIADARVVKQRNPWLTQISFSVVPSSNVNGGSTSDTLSGPGLEDIIFRDLSEDAMALKGIRATLNLRTQYRITQSPVHRLAVGGRYQGARVKLTDAETTPDETFATNAYELDLRYDRVLPKGALQLSLAARRTDYGVLDASDLTVDRLTYDSRRAEIGYRLPVDDRSEVSVALAKEKLSYEETAIGEIDRWSLRSAFGQRRANNDRWHMMLSYQDSVGDNDNYTSQALTLQTGYDWAEQLGPMTVGLDVGATWATYPDYALLGSRITNGRQDRTFFYNIEVGFPDAAFAGFIPVLTWAHNITDSNVSRTDRRTGSLGISINSAF